MDKIAQIIVNVPTKKINKPFSYAIPDTMSFLQRGYRVLVPFGSQKVEGFVVEIVQGDPSNLKTIITALDEYAWFDENMLKTADWVSKFCLCTYAEALRLFVPGKSGIKTESVYSISDDMNLDTALILLNNKPDIYINLITFLKHNRQSRLLSLKKQFGDDVLNILQYLTANKFVMRETIVHAAKRTKYQHNVTLAIDKSEAAAINNKLARSPAQQRLISALLEKTNLSNQELKQLNITQNTVKRLVEAGIVRIVKEQILRDSYSTYNGYTGKLSLTSEQQYCLDNIDIAIHSGKYRSFLLHGVTGSGKTQVYIEAAAKVRCNNRQVIVLVPEIALTGQIVDRFKAHFGDDVVVIHSRLSIAERYDAWQKLRTNHAGIAIGARSAIFAPLTNLGLVIIDEEHEFTYKQEESPRYHARQVAEIRTRLANAILMLGSATPSIETYFRSSLGKHTLLNMTKRVDGSAMPEVKVVDMREELRLGRRSVLSLPMQQLLDQTIEKKEQVILLLNRRGYATFILCRECGHVMECEHCSTALVYHTTSNTLRCHYCQSSHAVPDTCPDCGSRYIRYFGTGTQKLEQELFKLWPAIRVVRMDQDTTSGKMAHSRILADFAAGKYDVLLGTQMVAKGHDIKNVTAVGIIAADTTLNLPDFRAAERTFSLLTQASGRAGRGDKPGKVIIQTYNPDHYAVAAGAAQDYSSFYNREILHRKELFYPPFSQIVKLTVVAKDEKTARLQADDIALQLQTALASDSHSEVIGPFNAATFKVKDTYRINLLVKTVRLPIVRQIIIDLGICDRHNVYIDIEPANVM